MAGEKSRTQGRPSHLSAEFVVDSDEDAAAGDAGAPQSNSSGVLDEASRVKAQDTQTRPGRSTGTRTKVRADSKPKTTRSPRESPPRSPVSHRNVVSPKAMSPLQSQARLPHNRMARRNGSESIDVSHEVSEDTAGQEPIARRPPGTESERHPVRRQGDGEPRKSLVGHNLVPGRNIDLVQDRSAELRDAGERQQANGAADEGCASRQGKYWSLTVLKVCVASVSRL